MPRPGPRPYECVRRAWHSERHQPIRGSIIQEIFRLANETHCPATRKNKEWQEKLPFVVLKAEEIMYSKANYEDEYMEPTTLWERVHDAIDTIIRKDDANERADLLQPCIEAALILGCIPRRASRSQRHSSPVCYLSPKLKETADKDNDKARHVGSMSIIPPLLPKQYSNPHGSSTQHRMNYSSLEEPKLQFKASTASEVHKDYFDKPNLSLDLELPFQVRASSMPLDSCFWSKSGRVYPLYYVECHSKSGDCMTGKMVPSTGNDLSLRLGLRLLPARILRTEGLMRWRMRDRVARGTVNVESSLSSAREKGFDFFGADGNDEQHESCSSKWSSDCDCAVSMHE